MISKAFKKKICKSLLKELHSMWKWLGYGRSAILLVYNDDTSICLLINAGVSTNPCQTTVVYLNFIHPLSYITKVELICMGMVPGNLPPRNSSDTHLYSFSMMVPLFNFSPCLRI